MRKYAIGLIFAFTVMNVQAQETVLVQDFESWNAIKLEKDLGKLDVKAELQARLNNNASSMAQYFGQIGLEYKVLKPLKVGVGYRYIRQNEKEGFVTGGRLDLDAMYEKKLGDFKLDSRVRYTIRTEADEETSTNKIRLKAGLKYNIKGWKLDPKLSAEYFRVLDGAASAHDKMRYTLSTRYKLNKKLAIGAFYRLETELKENYPADYYILGLSYNINF